MHRYVKLLTERFERGCTANPTYNGNRAREYGGTHRRTGRNRVCLSSYRAEWLSTFAATRLQNGQKSLNSISTVHWRTSSSVKLLQHETRELVASEE